MKNTSLLYLGMICLMLGCSSGSHDKAVNHTRNQPEPPSQPTSAAHDEGGSPSGTYANAKSDTTYGTKDYISSSVAVENGKDSIHRFIRTADIKFKATNVVRATYQIEDITRTMHGFVQETRLSSNVDYTNTIGVSEDSSIEITYYTVRNMMTLRVPNTLLDSTLKSIAPLIDYLDYRNIKAEDAVLKMLANRLAQKRAERHNQSVETAVDAKGKKVSEITEAEESITNKQEQADNATISNMEIQDRISYSTINLEIYQRQDIKREMVANNKNIDAYRPSIIKRIGDALKSGWEVLLELLVSILHLWAVVLMGVLLFIAIRRWLRRRKA